MTQRAKSRVDRNLTGPHSGFEVPRQSPVWPRFGFRHTSAPQSFVSWGLDYGTPHTARGSGRVRRRQRVSAAREDGQTVDTPVPASPGVARLRPHRRQAARGGRQSERGRLHQDAHPPRRRAAEEADARARCETLKHVPITSGSRWSARGWRSRRILTRGATASARAGPEAPHAAAADGTDSYARLRAPEADGDAVPRSLAFVLAYELLFGAGIEEEESRSPAGGKGERGRGAAKGGGGSPRRSAPCFARQKRRSDGRRKRSSRRAERARRGGVFIGATRRQGPRRRPDAQPPRPRQHPQAVGGRGDAKVGQSPTQTRPPTCPTCWSLNRAQTSTTTRWSVPARSPCRARRAAYPRRRSNRSAGGCRRSLRGAGE